MPGVSERQNPLSFAHQYSVIIFALLKKWWEGPSWLDALCLRGRRGWICLCGCVYNTVGPEGTGSCYKWQEGTSVSRGAPIWYEYVFLVLFLISFEKPNMIRRINSCRFISMATFNWEEGPGRWTWGVQDPESLFYFWSLWSPKFSLFQSAVPSTSPSFFILSWSSQRKLYSYRWAYQHIDQLTPLPGSFPFWIHTMLPPLFQTSTEHTVCTTRFSTQFYSYVSVLIVYWVVTPRWIAIFLRTRVWLQFAFLTQQQFGPCWAYKI